jgi:hypothetical protein
MTRKRFIANWAVCWVEFGVLAALLVYLQPSVVLDRVFIVALVGALIFSMIREWRSLKRGQGL